jgi:hypothetical protein
VALPPAIITAVVNFGPMIDFAGDPIAGEVIFEASRPVVWTATGTPLLPSPLRVTLDDFGMGSIPLPATDQPGFSDGQGNAVTNWTYWRTVRLAGRADDRQPFALPTGGAHGVVLDLDLLVPVPSSQGIVVALPSVLNWVGLTGAIEAQDAADALAPSFENNYVPVKPVMPDAVSEWWIRPLATTLTSPYQRTVFGAIAPNGKVLACELNHATGVRRRYEVGQAAVDDHCTPALYAEAGHRFVLAWTNHNADSLTHFKVSDSAGTLGSFALSTDVTYSHTGIASYAQLHRITALSDATQDTFWYFGRVANDTWKLVPFSVNQATGSITFSSAVTLVSSGGRQSYISTTPGYGNGAQVIRVAWGYNPSQTENKLFYFEINTATGAITSPAHAGLSANVNGSGLPLLDTTLTPTVPTATTGTDRRLFYARPGPIAPAIGYAEWPTATPDTATYKIATWVPSNPTPDAYDGLILNGATAQSSNLQGRFPDYFTFEAFMRLPASAPGSGELNLLVLGDPTNPTLLFSVLPDGKRHVKGRFNTSTIDNTSSSTPLAGLWGTEIGVRLVRSASLNPTILHQYYTTNGGTTWTEIGSGLGVGTGTQLLHADPSAIVFTNGTGGEVPVYRKVRFYDTSTGIDVANADFQTGWPDRAASYTDPAGTSWTATGPAIVGTTTPPSGSISLTVRDLGPSGPRVGFLATANYVAGIAFPDPCPDDVVFRASSIAGLEAVDLLRNSGAGYITERLRQQDTTSGRLVRPNPPVNGGAIPALIVNMTSYSATTFTDFAGDLLTT